MKREMLMVAGGGTGGHIYPAIAIAREYIARGKDRHAVFVGTTYGLEKTIVPKNGFPLEFVRVGGLKGKSLLTTLQNIVKLPLGFVDAWRLISTHRPAAILGVGGYASGPIVMIGALRGIPTLIQESNAYPGLTNRILARFVSRIAVGFPGALPRLRGKGEVTGNPIRSEFFEVARPVNTDGRVKMLVFGGSQGSRILNTAVTGALLFLARFKDQLSITHQTGVSDHDAVAAAYQASAFNGARVVPYIDSMAQELADADLVVCRSGAMTVGELAAVGRAAVLVPFALATNNHQYENARVLADTGGAIVIEEKELTPERLAAAIGQICGDPEKARGMGETLRKLASPDSTSKIVQIIEEIQRIQLN